MDVFIPNEILKVKDLNITEKVVLAIYKYYTEQGKYKYCSLSKPQIADELGISVDYVKDIKKHLKELGYIKTDGGIRVIYVGVQGGNIVPTDDVQGGDRTPSGGGYNTQEGVIEHPVVGDITPTKWGIEHPHKKEKKEKENKKEKKGMTNFDLLLTRLPENYLTQERIDYMKEHYMDKINDVDMSDGGFESWITGIKIELNKIFPQEYKIEKKETVKVNDTIDLF